VGGAGSGERWRWHRHGRVRDDGLLPSVTGNFGVSISRAGHIVSAYALGVVVGAPLIAGTAVRWPRHRLLLALMGLIGVGNFARALAPGYASLMVVRLLAGLPHGAYFGVASSIYSYITPTLTQVAGLPVRYVVAHHAGMATAIVLLVGTGVAIVPALQLRLMDVAADAQTLSAALNHSAFNIANAVGASVGGVAIDAGLGWGRIRRAVQMNRAWH